ncbi:MAG: 2-oxoacid:acceptor oxidoreductase family protein, partial [Lachnospiraceae bacterium]|nr:2-oxoacid:acceptor oxidoreductase family protein [Lachnospiraceae bacterium]
DVMLMDVPADTRAKELGDIRMANNILIGALLGYTKMLPAEALKAGIRAKMAGKPEEVIEQNVKALMAGVEFGADMTHTQQIEPKVQKDCRYGIDKTTVGEILDTPELRAIVEKLFPQVLNHPLLEAGRTFKFVDAIPYMKDMISDDDLDNFQDALEELG